MRMTNNFEEREDDVNEDEEKEDVDHEDNNKSVGSIKDDLLMKLTIIDFFWSNVLQILCPNISVEICLYIFMFMLLNLKFMPNNTCPWLFVIICFTLCIFI